MVKALLGSLAVGVLAPAPGERGVSVTSATSPDGVRPQVTRRSQTSSSSQSRFDSLATCDEASDAMVAVHQVHASCTQWEDCAVHWDTGGAGPDSTQGGHCGVLLSDLAGPAAMNALVDRWIELGCENRGCNDDSPPGPACLDGMCVYLYADCEHGALGFPDADVPDLCW